MKSGKLIRIGALALVLALIALPSLTAAQDEGTEGAKDEGRRANREKVERTAAAALPAAVLERLAKVFPNAFVGPAKKNDDGSFAIPLRMRHGALRVTVAASGELEKVEIAPMRHGRRGGPRAMRGPGRRDSGGPFGRGPARAGERLRAFLERRRAGGSGDALRDPRRGFDGPEDGFRRFLRDGRPGPRRGAPAPRPTPDEKPERPTEGDSGSGGE